MSHDAPNGWIERRARAALKDETESLHAAVAEIGDARAELDEMKAQLAGLLSQVAVAC